MIDLFRFSDSDVTCSGFLSAQTNEKYPVGEADAICQYARI